MGEQDKEDVVVAIGCKKSEWRRFLCDGLMVAANCSTVDFYLRLTYLERVEKAARDVLSAGEALTAHESLRRLRRELTEGPHARGTPWDPAPRF